MKAGLPQPMASLDELDRIDWQNIECLGGSASALPKWIRQFAASPSEEERMSASEEAWTAAMFDQHLYEAAPYLVRFMIPFLADESREDQAVVLLNLGEACRAAREPKWDYALEAGYAKICEETLRAVEEGFPIYRKLLEEHPDLRNSIALIVTWYPEFAHQCLGLILAHYGETADHFERAELLCCLDRVAR